MSGVGACGGPAPLPGCDHHHPAGAAARGSLTGCVTDTFTCWSGALARCLLISFASLLCFPVVSASVSVTCFGPALLPASAAPLLSFRSAHSLLRYRFLPASCLSSCVVRLALPAFLPVPLVLPDSWFPVAGGTVGSWDWRCLHPNCCNAAREREPLLHHERLEPHAPRRVVVYIYRFQGRLLHGQALPWFRTLAESNAHCFHCAVSAR